jgi:hypothetical protein
MDTYHTKGRAWNRVLRRILGLRRKEVVGGWRRPHNEELPKLYASQILLG